MPAQAQVAANKLTYILLNLIKDGAIQDEGLLNFSYELIELSVQGEHADRGISQSPSGTITLLMDLAVRDTSFSYFSSLVNCLTAYLERKRFQDIIIANRMVDRALAVLERSFSVEEGRSRENVKSLTQLQLKLNQTLADVSASPLFIEIYPLNSPLTQTLKSWLTAGEDQLQICACVMLGNLARSDEVCEEMVRDLGIHTQLVSALNSDTRAAVLHSVLGFLKNLAIASGNRQRLGDADIIPAVSRLWSFETVPQVQFSAVSIARQVIISSVENISRLLDPVSDSDQQTYLLLLLSAFEKTDSVPIRTEVGRIVTSICRTLSPKAREQDPQASALLDRLFSLHPTLTNPVGAMITQTQWPVVRSEGWFSLALMASNPLGCQSVVNCLQNPDFFQVLEGTLSKAEASTEKAEGLQIAKDRDNVVVFVQELLKNGVRPAALRLDSSNPAQPDSLPPDLKTKLGDLMDHASRHLKGTSGS